MPNIFKRPQKQKMYFPKKKTYATHSLRTYPMHMKPMKQSYIWWIIKLISDFTLNMSGYFCMFCNALSIWNPPRAVGRLIGVSLNTEQYTVASGFSNSFIHLWLFNVNLHEERNTLTKKKSIIWRKISFFCFVSTVCTFVFKTVTHYYLFTVKNVNLNIHFVHFWV